MGILLRTVIALPLWFISGFIAYIGPQVVDPFAVMIADSQAVAQAGFDQSATVMINIGLRWGPIVVAIVIALWVIFGDIRRDLRIRRYA